MKKIEEIIDELRQWEKEGKGRAVAVAAMERGGDTYGNISGRGIEVIGAVACILKNAENNGITPRMILSFYEKIKNKIEECKTEEKGNERYS